ncbi:angiogenic factor with G patch and FHA domains 1-like [Orbicella faveolata]|uniref:angiogenic factor with G patch and FHA domains 1-like n=1 Tax=Orbicella faveolata TaxID=48498 RepID=UPI0009E3C920|nr:angiogenic factor with G patch and FHA domains 1-like [Orbicella faveolata]
MSQSGFVYDERTGLYYDWNTGYYYDPNSRLHYENTTGIYYYYDEPSATYKFHSKIDLSNNQEKTVNDDKNDQEERESGEEYSEDEEENDKDLEVIEVQFPCIRAIVIKASKIKVGSLFIVTYTGGTIGREKDMSHVIRIPDVEVSKLQCKIEFDKERRQFFIWDVGSRNGTFLNGRRLSESKQKSEQRVITHGDELTLGTTTLCLHIHPGTQTCDSCEPGQVQAQAPQGTSFSMDDEVCITKVIEGDRSLNSLSVQEQRKSELKRIKKAYALEESFYSEETIDSTLAGKYKDRADVRRTKVGSDVPVVVADDPPASVHRPISTENVGRQMLEKMGWKEGEGLGREGAGRREPVIVEVRDNLRGLGTGVKRSIDDVDGKSYIRSKTRERFGQAASVISGRQRFVAADTTQAEMKSQITDQTKQTEQPNANQVTLQISGAKVLDIFAE